MIGINGQTGKRLAGLEHLYQSVSDILTTPVGTRVMRRDYGSEVPYLIDAPANGETFARIYGAVATALDRWEPRLTLTNCRVTNVDAQGRLHLLLEGIIRISGAAFRMEGLILR